jgi:hypothetical protein
LIISSSERKSIHSPFCFEKDENVTLIFIEILVDVWQSERGEGDLWRLSYLNLVTAISNCKCVLLEV